MVMFFFLMATFAYAQNVPTFVGGGGNLLWSNPNNWSEGLKPVAGEFSVVVAADVLVDEDVLVTNLAYANEPCSMAIQAGKKLEITGNHAWNSSIDVVLENGAQLLTPTEVYAKVLMKVDAYDQETHTMEFIASPVVEPVTPSYGNGFLTDPDSGYSLVSFNEATLQWEDFKETPFDLENGRGYVYANALDTILIYEGTIRGSASVDVRLDYHASNGPVAGYNLVGNPLPCNAYPNHSYYDLSYSGFSMLAVPASTFTAIPPCKGVFMKAENENETVAFNSTIGLQSADNHGYITIDITKSNAPGDVIDNAILSFNSGDDMGKVIIFSTQPNLYFSRDNKDYAIISVDSVDMQPLKFKAAENGSYTMHVEPKGREVAFMHLIDNITGLNVDLLANPDYTFMATTNDYASRFKLVFRPDYGIEESENQNFAYYANGMVYINDVEAQDFASLQIVDLTGRVVVSCCGHTRCVPTAGIAPGVYVLRLETQNGVRTQKLVIQ